MKENFAESKTNLRQNERGSAMFKLIAILVVLFLIGHAGWNYIPVAYNCESFKQRMNEMTLNAYAAANLPESQPESVKTRMRRIANDYDVPADAFFKVDRGDNGTLKAQVYFKRQVDMLPFGLYRYTYEFNHTATPNNFLVGK